MHSPTPRLHGIDSGSICMLPVHNKPSLYALSVMTTSLACAQILSFFQGCIILALLTVLSITWVIQHEITVLGLSQS